MKNTMENCNFCKIINKEKKGNIVYENDLVCCFLAEEPINEGHMLITPKKHYLDLDQMDDEVAIEIMRVSKIMVKVLKDTYKSDGYSIMQMVEALIMLVIIICICFQDIKETVLAGAMEKRIVAPLKL